MHRGGFLSWYNSWSFVIICNLGWLTVWFSIWARPSLEESSYTIVSGNILGWLLPEPGSSSQFKTASQGQPWPVAKGKNSSSPPSPCLFWLRATHRYSYPAYSLSHLPLEPALRDGGDCKVRGCKRLALTQHLRAGLPLVWNNTHPFFTPR